MFKEFKKNMATKLAVKTFATAAFKVADKAFPEVKEGKVKELSNKDKELIVTVLALFGIIAYLGFMLYKNFKEALKVVKGDNTSKSLLSFEKVKAAGRLCLVMIDISILIVKSIIYVIDVRKIFISNNKED